MTTYAGLTPEQHAILAEGSARQRSLAGEIATLCNRLADFDAFYVATMSPILTELQADTPQTVPNPTGLAGAVDMTEAEHITLQSYIQGILAFNTSSHRSNYVKAAGFENTV